jgi:hypothetical protein
MRDVEQTTSATASFSVTNNNLSNSPILSTKVQHLPRMSTSEPRFHTQWVNELRTACALYKEGEFEGCIAHIHSVNRDTTPGYPRTRYHFCTREYTFQ